MEVRENQIEEILVHSPILIKELLTLTEIPQLVGRQLVLPSGRLDLLYFNNNTLFLIELKVTPYRINHLEQVLSYRKDLIEFQNQGKMINCPIQSHIFVPTISNSINNELASSDVFITQYKPEYLLEYFYASKLSPITSFVDKKPIDIGIWNIHLINDLIYLIAQGNSFDGVKRLLGLSPKTYYNKIKFAKELHLINWNPHSTEFSLTSLGEEYAHAKDVNYDGIISESQAKLLRNYVIQNPYSSSIIVGIASMVECVFSLAKITYPVPIELIKDYFTYHSGKIYNWQSKKSKKHGTVMYSNYAIDLGLLAKTEKNVFITPEGMKFILQLQLHKGLKLIEKVDINFD